MRIATSSLATGGRSNKGVVQILSCVHSWGSVVRIMFPPGTPAFEDPAEALVVLAFLPALDGAHIDVRAERELDVARKPDAEAVEVGGEADFARGVVP